MTWGMSGTGPGELKEPIGIDIKEKEVFISEGGNNRIQVFDLNGNFLRMFGHKGTGLGELGRPMLMDIRNGKVYVTEYHNDRIHIFNLRGDPITTIGSSGSGPGQLDSPGGVDIDKEGRLYVADFFNHRVQVFAPDGSFLRKWEALLLWIFMEASTDGLKQQLLLKWVRLEIYLWLNFITIVYRNLPLKEISSFLLDPKA